VILAFALIVLVEGEQISTAKPMAFRDVNRCRYFEKKIEHRQQNVTAYCLPRWFPASTTFSD